MGRYRIKPKKKVRVDSKKTVGTHQQMVWFDYHSLAFLQFHADEGVQRALKGVHPSRREFWKLVPDGEYSPQSGHDLVLRYLRSVEDEMAEALRPHSIGYYLHVCRRLSPHSIDEDSRPATLALVRATLEAAIQKYAKPGECSRLARTDTITPERIFRGLLYNDADLWRIYSPTLKQPQLVLTDFGPPELAEVYRLEKLAYEIWKCSAVLRALGKGCTLVVSSESPYFGHQTNDDYQRLLELYDERQVVQEVSSTGTVFPSPQNDHIVAGSALVPGYNGHRIPWAALKDIFLKAFKVKIDSLDMTEPMPNFIWFPFDLLSFYIAHEPFAEAFREAHGFKLSSVIAVLSALTVRIMRRWMEVPGVVVRHWLRAYDGPDELEHRIGLIRDSLPLALQLTPMGISPEDVEIEPVVRFFSYRSDTAAQIDLAVPGPHSIFLPVAGGIFTDYAWISARLHRLFYGLNLPDQNFKGDTLEKLVRNGESALPVKACKALDGSKKQMDAAFDLGNALLIAECKVKARSIGWERGTPEAVSERERFVREALRQADEKAIWLANHPLGSNYDIRRFEWVLAVAVTPFAEFLWSKSSYYWLTDKLPRIMTPAELKTALDDGEFHALAVHHQLSNRVRIDAGSSDI